MTMHCIKLSDDRTELCVEDNTGCLFESGGNYPKFHRTATDTFALLQLLQEHEATIKSAHAREVGAARAGKLLQAYKVETGEQSTSGDHV